jgi:hypothetical protein
MSVGSIGPTPPIPPSFGGSPAPGTPEEIYQAFDRVYVNFVNDSSTQNANDLLTFLESNHTTLAQFAIYPPYLGETWDRLYTDVKRDLIGFMAGKLPLSVVMENADNMRIMLGVNVTPADILNELEQAMAAFKVDPNDRSSLDLIYLYMSTPGYVDALAQSNVQPGFIQTCQAISQVIGQFRSGHGSEQSAEFAIQQLRIALNLIA